MNQDVLPSLNIEAAVERMGDREIYVEVARCFGESLEQALPHVEAALDQGDLETANRLFHSMKSNCGAVGAEELQKHCRELEQVCQQGNAAYAVCLFTKIKPQLELLKNMLGGRV